MPIEVHCPNPDCARIHLVKNQYAGMRGKCPVCASWMYVPQEGHLPSMLAPRPEGLDEAAAWKREAKPAPQPSKPTQLQAPQPAAKPSEEKDEPILATLDEPATDKPRRRFSWLAALLIVLGMAGLGLVIAAPKLPKPEATGTGDYENDKIFRSIKGIEDHQLREYLQWLAPSVAAGALLALITALLTRRFDFPSLLLIYLTTAGASLVLLLALKTYSSEMTNLTNVEKGAERRKATSQGEYTIDKGLQLYALAGGAIGACGAFLLAAVAAHRRWSSKLVGFVALAAMIAMAPVWVYQEEWGLADYIPSVVKNYMPF